MPVSGRKPKPEGMAVHRNRPTHDWTEVEDVPFEGGPTLVGNERPCRRPWPPWTKSRWAIWRRMPHCVLWTESDWAFAFDTLEIAARFHENTGRMNLAAELRNRERVMGTTADYRRDLRIRYVKPKVVAPVIELVRDDYGDL